LILYATGYPTCLRLINTTRHEVLQKLKIEAEIRSLVFDKQVGRYGLLGGGNGCIYVVQIFSSGVNNAT